MQGNLHGAPETQTRHGVSRTASPLRLTPYAGLQGTVRTRIVGPYPT